MGRLPHWCRPFSILNNRKVMASISLFTSHRLFSNSVGTSVVLLSLGEQSFQFSIIIFQVRHSDLSYYYFRTSLKSDTDYFSALLYIFQSFIFWSKYLIMFSFPSFSVNIAAKCDVAREIPT